MSATASFQKVDLKNEPGGMFRKLSAGNSSGNCCLSQRVLVGIIFVHDSTIRTYIQVLTASCQKLQSGIMSPDPGIFELSMGILKYTSAMCLGCAWLSLALVTAVYFANACINRHDRIHTVHLNQKRRPRAVGSGSGDLIPDLSSEL